MARTIIRIAETMKACSTTLREQFPLTDITPNQQTVAAEDFNRR